MRFVSTVLFTFPKEYTFCVIFFILYVAPLLEFLSASHRILRKKNLLDNFKNLNDSGTNRDS